jgi:hypothetical protein
MNKIDDALKALPSGLTWGQAFDLIPGEALSLWKISGKVAATDELNGVDRRRLADAIVKQQTSAKEEITMTSTDEGADAMFADADQRQYLLAAAENRSRLQQSDNESILDIAARLKKAVETARATDAAQRRPKATFDAAGHRPGWRLDARRKNRQEEQEEGEDEDEKALSDARREHDTYITSAYKQGR